MLDVMKVIVRRSLPGLVGVARDTRRLGVILCFACTQVVAGVDVGSFIKKDSFQDITISPTGEYYAATVPSEDRTGLVILRRSDNKQTASFALGENIHIQDFWWVNSNRLVFSVAEKFGALDEPQLTGELWAVDADGERMDLLVGYRKLERNTERVVAFLVDDLSGDDENVIISVAPLSEDAYTRAEKINVYSGRRTHIAKVPVRRARFVTDSRGLVRLAVGAGLDNVSKLFFRNAEDEEWKLINDEAVTNHVEYPLGFSADGNVAYLEAEQGTGPNSILAFDVRTGVRTEIIRDRISDPWLSIGAIGAGGYPVGTVFMSDLPRTVFFDPGSAEARIQRSLETAFPDQWVRVTSTTADGKLALVSISSASNPGDFYIFDVERKKASLLLSRRDWFDPEQMAEVRPIELKSRDGLVLHGYLTLPKADGKNLPVVIMPHGGPIGIFDKWTFNDDAQLLARAGYAVLQVNFRGSGNYGRSFLQAGAQQWGGAMQDDLTDATRWAVAEGIADPGRICIYGASYGGYAALMGVSREPTLYKCAVGYVGVYDLAMMVAEDGRASMSTAKWMREWVGKGDGLAAISPTTAALASRITVPVFLAAGKEDEVAPIAHSKKMEAALRKAGVPVETLYLAHEGHGFYVPENRRAYYVKLLDFLARHIGGERAN